MNRTELVTSLRTQSWVVVVLVGAALAGCPTPTDPPVMVDAGRDAPTPDAPTIPDAGEDPDAPEEDDAGPPVICTMDEDCDDGDTCTGTETCGAGGFACVPGTGVAEGTDCDADAEPTTRDICLGGSCGATRCGDGFTDTTALEECDDGNGVNGDGCDDCRFTCEAATDCDDGEACNGAETCSAAHLCVPGTNLPNGTDCASMTGRCVAGTCLPDTCTDADECQDGDLCNGDEVCNAGTGCAPAAAPTDCDDADECTADSCDPAVGCGHAFIDADGDGHAPATLTTCGDDCDDTRADTSPSVAEVCGNGRDDDCDGMTDEVAMTTWFADCDGDGFAAAGAMMRNACAMPPAGLSGCTSGGGWTTRAPTEAANQDCNDGNAAVNPAQTAFQTTAISGAAAPVDFDYDCNTTEERRVTTVGSCTGSLTTPCRLVEGWMGSAPMCGATATWITSCTRNALGCTTGTEMRTQACR